MVEMITRYRTADGLDFPTREEAEKHERTAVPRMLANDIAGASEADLVEVLTDRSVAPPLADATERAGAIIRAQRLAARDLRRKPKVGAAAGAQGQAAPDGRGGGAEPVPDEAAGENDGDAQ